MRTCVGCRRRAEQDELIRIGAGGAQVSVGRSVQGRGAWLCRDERCFTFAQKGARLSRALKRPLTPRELDALRVAFVSEIENMRG